MGDNSKYSYGLVPSKKDLRNYKLNKKLCYATKLPEQYEVNHGAIKDQGRVNSCVAHSTAEIFEAAVVNQKFSTDWIYGYRPLGYYQGEGMMVSNALKTVTKLGAVKFIDLPSNTEIPKAKEIVDKNFDKYKELASENRSLKYARIYTLTELKESIYLTGLPAIAAITIGERGLRLSKDGVAELPEGCAGGHAVVCYGWNEKGLLIQNSWGTSWGKNGTFILPYDYSPSEMWTLTFNDGIVVKPKLYWLRELVEAIIKAITQLFTKK